MKKIYARVNDCRQYSEDGWEAIVHIKEVTPETTIADLMEWQKKLFYGNCNPQKIKEFSQIFISEGE